MDKIKIAKLNKNYQSDPNVANPEVKINNKELTLLFELNSTLFNFKEGQIGEIVFSNCSSYRIGKPNDEGFYLNDNVVWNKSNFPNLEWNCFYEVQGAPNSYLQGFKPLENLSEVRTKLKHYVFFMKEATFECLAESYKEILGL